MKKHAAGTPIAILLALSLCLGLLACATASSETSSDTQQQQDSVVEVTTGRKTIGILGGMGPLATADLMRKIVYVTDADTDNENVRVYVDSNTYVPDRTAAILHGGEDPVPEMLTGIRHLEACNADCILVACNTAHYFLPRLQAETDIPILNMPAITARRCAELYPGKTAGILATTGTLDAGIYNKALTEEGVPYVVPNDAEREETMHLIYDVVKASQPVEPEDGAWHNLLQGMRERGADYFILACTELPILAEGLSDQGPFIDPTWELAREAVLFCGYPVIEESEDDTATADGTEEASEAETEDDTESADDLDMAA